MRKEQQQARVKRRQLLALMCNALIICESQDEIPSKPFCTIAVTDLPQHDLPVKRTLVRIARASGCNTNFITCEAIWLTSCSCGDQP